MIGVGHIHSTLQAAALRMTGNEFEAFTAQARDLFHQSDEAGLERLVSGKGIDADLRVVNQIVTGRAMFFGDVSIDRDSHKSLLLKRAVRCLDEHPDVNSEAAMLFFQMVFRDFRMTHLLEPLSRA